MIVEVTGTNLAQAAYIHATSWQESHRSFCSEAFVLSHTPERQLGYLRQEMDAGKQLYMLLDEAPVGIVSIQDNLIENLYILPQVQRKGYGGTLLRFAISQCKGNATLWVLSNNTSALSFYQKHGFRFTGNRKQLQDDLFELELAHQ